MRTGVGGMIDGTFRRYGVFDQTGLVKMPETLDYKQASTLPCAALTAWNALYGLESKKLIPGHTVLTQGTGGVSMFGLQVSHDGSRLPMFQRHLGCCCVILTSSSLVCESCWRNGHFYNVF